MVLDRDHLASLGLMHCCCHSLHHLDSCASSFLVVWFLICFSFSLFMLLKTYS